MIRWLRHFFRDRIGPLLDPQPAERTGLLIRNAITERDAIAIRNAFRTVDGLFPDVYRDLDWPDDCAEGQACKVTFNNEADRGEHQFCDNHAPRGRHHADPPTDQFTAADWDAIASWGDHAEEEK